MRNHTFALAVLELCSRVVTLVRIIQIDLITSAYFLYDVDESSPTKNMRGVITAFSRGKQFITDSDASVLHVIEEKKAEWNIG